MKDLDSRLPFLDLLRAVASQAIVWHHLAFYGPLSDSAHDVASTLIDGLAQHARLAVQVFFVVSGYLSALSVRGCEPTRLREVFVLIAERYRRIGLPYLGALLLSICANELARHWMAHPSISARPTLPSLLAHVFLLHDVLGYEPLSAGIWYLAIDLQLTSLLGLVFWMSARAAGAERGPFLGRLALAALGVLSLFWFNRYTSLDRVAIYFMGAYAFGLLAAWTQTGAVRRAYFWGYAALLAVALAIDFRSRLLVALATGLALSLARHRGWLGYWPRSPAVRWLAQISYSLFLVHFPVSLVVNALWSSHVPSTPWLSLLGMVAAYSLSTLVAVAFHYRVERPLLSLGRGQRERLALRVLLDREADSNQD